MTSAIPVQCSVECSIMHLSWSVEKKNKNTIPFCPEKPDVISYTNLSANVQNAVNVLYYYISQVVV